MKQATREEEKESDAWHEAAMNAEQKTNESYTNTRKQGTKEPRT